LQLRITSDKDVHEAGNAVKLARRNEAALARQLQQAGLEPKLLLTATADMDLVMADVPEARLRQVWVGQACRARFFGLPDKAFPGKVMSISPVVSKERRTLRVLFVLDDPQDLLRPGMFAEIGLGTDPRQALLVPADAVIHIARSDYVLVSAERGNWKVVEVKVGEQHGQRVEVVEGLSPGERVVSQGAILLKPAAARSLLPGAAAERGDR
jgi:RND family efflux transporter MFP subunit